MNMMVKTPNVYRLARGASEGFSLLNAFDGALLQAGVGDTNLVRMSSIVPPGARQTDRLLLPKGGLIPVAYAHIGSDVPGQVISAAIALAIPTDPSLPGVIMEYEATDPLEVVEAHVRKMAEEAFVMRNRELAEIRSLGVEHTVKSCGAVFAAAVLWYE